VDVKDIRLIKIRSRYSYWGITEDETFDSSTTVSSIEFYRLDRALVHAHATFCALIRVFDIGPLVN
jgi:hypothetical protein